MPTKTKKTTPSKKAPVRRKSKPAKKKGGFILSKRAKILTALGVGLALVIVGTYLIATNAASATYSFVGIGGKCLDNNARKTVDKNKIQLWGCNQSVAQQWKVNSNGTITNANGKCLDVAGAGTTKKTIVWLYHCNGTVAQKWKVDSKTHTIHYNNPKAHNLCLDDKYAETANGTQIWVYTCNGTAAQQWTATKISAPEPSTPDTGANPTPTTPAPAPSGTKKHFIQNSTLGDAAKLKSLGYNVIDATPDDVGSLGSLPSGMQAMVWTGDAFCDKEIMNWSSFKKLVYNNRSNSRIYGYFLEDEPDTHSCAHIVKVVRDRADYIHCLAIQSDKYSNGKPKVAKDGSCLDDKGNQIARKTKQMAYVVDEYQYDYAKVSKAAIHADIFAIDPYPCRKSCVYNGGQDQFLQRIDKAKKYYPQANIAPTYQAFGGDGWTLPTASQMKQIQSYYDSRLPGSVFDVAYSYRDNKSGGPGDTYPGLIHAPASLQQVMKDHNLKK